MPVSVLGRQVRSLVVPVATAALVAVLHAIIPAHACYLLTGIPIHFMPLCVPISGLGGQVRSLMVPAATAALVAVLHVARLLPSDPVCRLVLLVQVGAGCPRSWD